MTDLLVVLTLLIECVSPISKKISGIIVFLNDYK